jgi:broad specificity phosphatase PhoE
LFVRHSLPVLEESIERRFWHLSDEGRRRADAMADYLKRYDVQAIVSSDELKSIETAHAISTRLNCPFEVDARLREHSIDPEPFRSEPAFKRLVHSFFASPDEVVFGTESAVAACDRLATAVSAAREKYPTGDVALVSHGRLLSAYLAPILDTDPFALWKRLKTPALVALSLPKLEVADVVETFER